MTEVWVGIILLANQLGAILIDKEFEKHDDCWKHYVTHPRMERVENYIPTTRPVMLFKIQSFGLGWITGSNGKWNYDPIGTTVLNKRPAKYARSINYFYSSSLSASLGL